MGRIGKILATLALAAAPLAATTAAHADPSPTTTPSASPTSPTTPPAAPAAGVTCIIESSVHYPADSWWLSGSNQWTIHYDFLGPGWCYQTIAEGGGWYELAEYNITTGVRDGCITFSVAGGGDLVDHACQNLVSQQWAWEDTGYAGGSSLFWNRYFNANYPGWCADSASAVFTDNYPDGLAYLACPENGNPGNYSWNQYWIPSFAQMVG